MSSARAEPSRRSIRVQAEQILERPRRVGRSAELPAGAAELELAMRAVLRLFAEGRLVYRARESRVALDVPSTARRLRALRAG